MIGKYQYDSDNTVDQTPSSRLRDADLRHEETIKINRRRIVVSLALGTTGMMGLFMAADTLINPNPSDPPPIVELIAESGLAVTGIGLAIPIGRDAINNLSAYDK